MLASYYLVHGNDIQKNLKMIKEIKKTAYDAGYHHQIVFEIANKFDWNQLFIKYINLDLFTVKIFIELRITNNILNKHTNTEIYNFIKQRIVNLCTLITANQDQSMLDTDWTNYIKKFGKVYINKLMPPIYQLVHYALIGECKLIFKLLHDLKNIDEDPILILHGITKEIRKLLCIRYEKQQVNKHQLNALKRLSTDNLHDLLNFRAI